MEAIVEDYRVKKLIGSPLECAEYIRIQSLTAKVTITIEPTIEAPKAEPQPAHKAKAIKVERKTKGNAWPQSHIDELLKGVSDHEPMGAIAARLGRTVGACYVMHSKIKGQHQAKPSKAGEWTPEQDQKLIELSPHKTMGELKRALFKRESQIKARMIELKNEGRL